MRLGWIDIARGICMFCVVLSHCKYDPPIYRCIFEPFFLTTFFFLSGVVSKPNPVKETIYNSSIKILWPYIINSIIFTFFSPTCIKLIIHRDVNDIIEYMRYMGEKIICGDFFWFLSCLFIVQIIASIITYIFKSNKRYIIPIALLCLLSIYIISGEGIAPWNINTAIVATGYFLIGVCLKDKVISFQLPEKKKYIGIAAATIYILIIISIYIISPNPILYDLHTHRLSPELLYLFLSIIGITAVCMSALSIKRCKLLQLIGSNSLLIYMYHGLVCRHTKAAFSYLELDSLSQNPYIYSLLISIVTTLLTLLIAIIITKYIPILIGRGTHCDKVYQYLQKSSIK